ncbi:MAG: tail fiber domain-containing protein [bacterium]|nr:tail fiber domain-containing protein [bacterium]
MIQSYKLKAISYKLVSAAPNYQINYQGKLANSVGVVVADGTYQLVFNLYTVASGGSTIWTETYSGANEITVTDGLFSTMLGSLTSIASVDFNQTLYLGVTVEADSEMTPRKILGAVPAAFQADKLDGLDAADFISTSTASLTKVWSLTGLGQIGSSTATTTFLGNLTAVGTTVLNGILSVYQNVTAPYFTATSTSQASTLPYASTTMISATTASSTNLIASNSATFSFLGTGLTKLTSGALGLATAGTDYLTNAFASWAIDSGGYLTATNTALVIKQPSGFLSTASSTIVGGLTITGNATATNATTTGALSTVTLGVGTDYLTDITGSGLTITSGALTVSSGVANLTNYDWTFGSTYGLNNLTPTSTMPIWAQGGINASSTSHFNYASTTALTVSGSGSAFIVSTGNVGIGTSTPQQKLSMYDASNAYLQLVSDNNAGIYLEDYNSAPNNALIYKTARGSFGTPTTLASGDIIGDIQGNAYDGSSFILGSRILHNVDGTVGTNDMPTRLSFWTTPDGSATIAERMRIDNAGNIGIGTTTPQWLLNPFSATAPQLSLSAGAGIAQWAFRNAGGNLYFATTTTAGTATSSPSALTILNSGGYVGVGTAAPTQKLTVTGTSVSGTASQTNISAFVNNGFRIIGNLSGGAASQDAITYASDGGGGGAALAFGRGSSWDTFMAFYTNPTSGSSAGAMTERMRIDSAGNVGIGTTSPYSLLSIGGAAAGTLASVFNSTGQATIPYASTTALTVSGNAYFPDSSIFNSSGYLGVGSSTPLYPLTIKQAPVTSNTANIFVDGSGLGGAILDLARDSSPSWESVIRFSTANLTTPLQWKLGLDNDSTNNFYLMDADDNKFLTVTDQGSTGNVGIGTTTPQWLLNPFSATAPQLSLSAGAGVAQWAFRNAGGNLYFATTTTAGTATTSTSALSILSSNGNVGIGTAAPSQLLTLSNYLPTLYFDDNGEDDMFVRMNGHALEFFSTTGFRNQLMLTGPSNSAPNRVGVGTSTPAGQLAASSTNVVTAVFDQEGTSDILRLLNGANNRLTVTAAGNVGIGTTTPGTLLSLGNTGANTINISTTATSTFGSGLNILTGCYAINGSCSTGAVGGGNINSGTVGGLAYYTGSTAVSSGATGPDDGLVWDATSNILGIATTSALGTSAGSLIVKQINSGSYFGITGGNGANATTTYLSVGRGLLTNTSGSGGTGADVYIGGGGNGTDFVGGANGGNAGNLYLAQGGSPGTGTAGNDGIVTIGNASVSNNAKLALNGWLTTSLNIGYGNFIKATTTDGADNSYTCLTGGGDCGIFGSATRGAGVVLLGNEYPDIAGIPVGGNLEIVAGNPVDSSLVNGEIIFNTGGSNNMILLKSGKLGIGTTTPAWQLQVASSSKAFFALSDMNAAANKKHWTLSSQGGSFYIATSSDAYATSSKTALEINANGALILPSLTTGTGDALCTSVFKNVTFNSGATSCLASSLRFKHDITDLDIGLKEILELRPVAYKQNSDNAAEVGLIAEDVEQVDKRLMFYEADGVTPRGVRYEQLTAVLAKAIQEQQGQIDLVMTTLNLTASSTAAGGLWTIDDTTGRMRAFSSLDINNLDIANVRSIQSGSGDWSISATGVLVVKEVRVDKLCLGNICITETDLKNLLDKAGLGAVGSAPDGGATPPPPAPEPEPEPTPIPEPELPTPEEVGTPTDSVGADPESTPEPTPTPAPESAPAPEPAPALPTPTDGGVGTPTDSVGADPAPTPTPEPVPTPSTP